MINRRRLRLTSTERFDGDIIRLSHAPSDCAAAWLERRDLAHSRLRLRVMLAPRHV
ncbi:hypothetical protein [Aminobacter ciceronei]|jgi:hypothetical protein|uniref:hypothetical protein n=1 Tax=Aminobacter ciceronei TaxID=150723 RepID=UPI003F6E81DC